MLYFISDLHLGLQETEIEKRKEALLVSLLSHIRSDAEKLFILGDLFDYWFEYKRVIQKGFFRTLTALADLSEAGTEIHYIIGNHDFLHRDFFEREVGVKLYHEPLSITLEGKKFFLGHGDGLVENDLGYRILKKVFRNKPAQKIYSLLHPDLGIKLASSTSKTSRTYTSEKNYGEVDGLKKTAFRLIEEGYDYVMFGHTHRRTFEKHRDGYYINLGSWLDQPCYGTFSHQEFKIIDWE
jgi:UDP-2,3-diacylglucosamine hydrolase